MKKVHFLVMAIAIVGFSSCEKENIEPEPEPLEKEFKVIDYDAFIQSGDTSSYDYFTDQQTPALYIQGYAEDSLFSMRVTDYWIPPNGREGDWIFHETRDFTTITGQATVLPYQEIRAGEHAVALYFMEGSQRKFIMNIFFDVAE